MPLLRGFHMKPLSIEKQIADSANRILAQLEALPAQTDLDGVASDYENFVQSIRDEVDSMGQQGEQILKDLTDWTASRKKQYGAFDEPLMRQIEENQTIDSEITAEGIPKIQAQITSFDEKINEAKRKLVAMGRQAHQVALDVKNGGREQTPLPVLRLEKSMTEELPSISGSKDAKDEENELIFSTSYNPRPDWRRKIFRPFDDIGKRIGRYTW